MILNYIITIVFIESLLIFLLRIHSHIIKIFLVDRLLSIIGLYREVLQYYSSSKYIYISDLI